MGFIASCEQPRPLILLLMLWFKSRYSLKMEEAEKKWYHYRSLGDLFTRKLKPELRPVAVSPLVHPCDSEVLRYGKIENDVLIQAKGLNYSLQEFVPLADIRDLYSFGTYVTYYLCPTDYHRVHSPVQGEIKKVLHIEGDLRPVKKELVKRHPRLYATNERVYVEIHTPQGPVGVVFVGATNVGSIRLSFDPSVRGNSKSAKKGPIVYTPPLSLQKGAELGVFNMGSTIVLLLSSAVAKDVAWSSLKREAVIFGQSLPMNNQVV